MSFERSPLGEHSKLARLEESEHFGKSRNARDRSAGALLLALPFLLAACPGPSSPPKMTTGSAYQLTPGAVSVQTTGYGDALSTLVVALRDAQGNRVGGGTAGGAVSLFGGTLAYGNPATGSDLTFYPLASGSYTVRIEVPGYVTQVVSGVSLGATASVTATVTMTPQGGTLTGHVQDGASHPVFGAWISDGACLALTDSSGNFTMGGCPTGAQTLTIRKTGFQTATEQVSVSGATTAPAVTMQGTTPKIYFYNASATYAGQPIDTAFAGLRSALAAAGFTVTDTDSTADTWLVISPQSLPAGATSQIASFVAGGGKLVVMGEWAGYPGYDPDVANALLAPAGLFLDPDLVRSPDNQGRTEWPIIRNFPANLPTGQGVSAIGLFEGADLYTVPPAGALATPNGNAYQVMDMASAGYLPVAAYTQSGKGLIVAIGDASAWSDSPTLGTGTDLAQLGNKTFVLDLFSW